MLNCPDLLDFVLKPLTGPEIAAQRDQKIPLNEAANLSIIRTRQYVKRQLTWFRGQMKDWTEFNDSNQSNLRKKILKYIRTS